MKREAKRKRYESPTARGRQGFALLMVLISLAVTMAFCVAVTRSALVVRKTIDLQLREGQSECLAESGLSRAAAKLAIDRQYAGETWRLSPADMGGRDGAKVQIHVEKGSDPELRTIRVEADYPDDAFDRARVSREIKIRLTKGSRK